MKNVPRLVWWGLAINVVVMCGALLFLNLELYGGVTISRASAWTPLIGCFPCLSWAACSCS